MSSSPRTGSRFMRWLQRTPETQQPATPDPADMGTCFGLELSMSDEPQDPFGRTPHPPRPPRDGGAD
jgi:hypothetical protein